MMIHQSSPRRLNAETTQMPTNEVMPKALPMDRTKVRKTLIPTKNQSTFRILWHQSPMCQQLPSLTLRLQSPIRLRLKPMRLRLSPLLPRQSPTLPPQNPMPQATMRHTQRLLTAVSLLLLRAQVLQRRNNENAILTFL